MNNRKLEICCYTVESAIIAEEAGADRIELCDNYSEGGTTPSYGAVKSAIQYLSIPVNVIIRPRGGDFLYSESEFGIMKDDIVKVKEMGANGIVTGVLNSKGEIDIGRIKEIIELAEPMEVTFHRAFDMCSDPLNALNRLIDLGIDRILTSGCMNTALAGIDLISKLVEEAEDRIIIMPGSGINETNIQEILAKTGAKEFHSSAKIFMDSRMKYTYNQLCMGDSGNTDEYKVISVDPEKIKRMKSVLL